MRVLLAAALASVAAGCGLKDEPPPLVQVAPRRVDAPPPARVRPVEIEEPRPLFVDPGPRVCEPETDALFCRDAMSNCGMVSALDNCGQGRTVTSCGTCTQGESCGTLLINLCGYPVIDLVDTFDDSVKPAAWAYVGATRKMREVQFAVPTYGGGRHRIHTQRPHDLTNRSVQAELALLPRLANVYTEIAVGTPDGVAGFACTIVGAAVARAATGSRGGWATLEEAPYDEVRMRFLRIRETTGSLYCEASPRPDGPWTTIGATSHAMAIKAVHVWIAVGATGENPAGEIVSWDNVNSAGDWYLDPKDVHASLRRTREGDWLNYPQADPTYLTYKRWGQQPLVRRSR